MKGHRETLGGQAEEYRRMMLQASSRHESDTRQLKATIAEIQEQLYDSYKRQAELVDEVNSLRRKLNGGTNTSTEAE